LDGSTNGLVPKGTSNLQLLHLSQSKLMWKEREFEKWKSRELFSTVLAFGHLAFIFNPIHSFSSGLSSESFDHERIIVPSKSSTTSAFRFQPGEY
jgi:hypothetical protein